MIAVVILAAGSSRRLGRAKQLEMVGGETLLRRVVRVANEAGLGRVIVVVRAEDVAVLAEARRLRCEVIENDEADEGMAASVRAGVTAAGNAEGMVVMTCDQPAVTADHLRGLGAEPDEVVASAYAGRRGVPAYFPARVFGELSRLRGDVGARELLQGARARELEGGEVDVDTEEGLARARALVESRS